MTPEEAVAKVIKNLEAFRPLLDSAGLRFRNFSPDLDHLIERLQPDGDLGQALLQKPEVLAEGWMWVDAPHRKQTGIMIHQMRGPGVDRRVAIIALEEKE